MRHGVSGSSRAHAPDRARRGVPHRVHAPAQEARQPIEGPLGACAALRGVWRPLRVGGGKDVSLERLVDCGELRRNGRAFCGVCRAVEDPIRGGRRRRKAEGWRYHSDAFGWTCTTCSRRFLNELPEAIELELLELDARAHVGCSLGNIPRTPGVRGFGFQTIASVATTKRPTRKGARRRRLAAQRERERDLRAGGRTIVDRAANRPRGGGTRT